MPKEEKEDGELPALPGLYDGGEPLGGDENVELGR